MLFRAPESPRQHGNKAPRHQLPKWISGSEVEYRRSESAQEKNRQAHTKGGAQGTGGAGEIWRCAEAETDRPDSGTEGDERDQRGTIGEIEVEDAGLDLSKGEGQKNNKNKKKFEIQ